MRIVFFGSGAFGLPTLQALARKAGASGKSAEHEIAAVITQPDRPAGRGGTLTPTPIAAWAAEHLPDVPLLKPEKVNQAEVVERIRGFGIPHGSAPDADPSGVAWVVIAFGQKLGQTLLADRWAINLHASLLPRWRGAAPINAAILAGDAETGNSVITLADRMDAGLILAQSRRPIYPDLTAGELHDLLALDGPDLVRCVLEEKYRLGKPAHPRPQDEAQVTIAPKLSKVDGWVDFAEDAEACRRRVHGLTPWPGVTVMFRETPLKPARVQVARADETHDHASGTILDAESGIVACGMGTRLRVLEVVPAGRKHMSWPDFARGQRVTSGERLIGRSAEPGGRQGC